MIIVKVMGGLGNQMFQYALYERLKKQNKCVKLDLNHYKACNDHNGFELNRVFNIDFDKATGKEINKLADNKRNILSRVRRKAFGVKNTHYYDQEKVFDASIFSKNNVYLDGYWQSEKYFLNIRNILLEKFKFNITDKKNSNVVDEIKKSNSISLHVRRGDYLKGGNATIYADIVGLDYYKNAVEIIKEKVDNPKFFVFSDDLQWVKDNLKLENAVFVDFNRGKDSYKDMFLMSQCKHNIIANSTFSWWGAWLNQNEDKIVIAPNKWLNVDKMQDIWCDSWIKCSVESNKDTRVNIS